jgi:hypothetical protein
MVTLTACNENEKYHSDKRASTSMTIPVITDDENIIGQWTMCSTSGNGFVTNYNVCPTVTFTTHGTAFINFPSGTVESFSWTLKNKALTISHVARSSDNIFSDTTYVASIGQENGSLDLHIRHITKNRLTICPSVFAI